MFVIVKHFSLFFQRMIYAKHTNFRILATDKKLKNKVKKNFSAA